MITNIIFFLTLIAYAIIASQSFMYILALKDVQLNLEAGPYIGLRKLLDRNMRHNFRYVIYAALLFCLLLVLANIQNAPSLVFITAIIAFVALVVDTILTVKGNLPINDIMNAWTAENYPANWRDYRAKWLRVFQYRQIANITGFVSLLVGVVFGH